MIYIDIFYYEWRVTARQHTGGRLILKGKALVWRLCRRTDTSFKDEGNGHRRTRFIRTMKRNTGNKEKMWAGQTAPFFCPQKSKKALVGPFSRTRG
ncbi:hypothetical protein EI969_24735 [Pseudomonas sp. PB101]|nr:hypothetical protein [Pseudomonas sp. PB101]